MLKILHIDLYHIAPEITMILGAFLALMVGVFLKTKAFRITSNLTLLVFIASVYQILHVENGTFLLFNDSFLVSNFTQLTKIIIIACNFMALLAISYFERQTSTFETPILISISALGMCIFVSSNSLLVLYLGLELFSLSLYILIATNRDDEKSIEASLKYFILGSISSGIFLLGASLIYGYTGVINFDEISFIYSSNYCCSSHDATHSPILLIGLMLLIITMMFKLSLFPFHNWAPDVYEGSPTTITMILASSAKYAVFALFLRLIFEPLLVFKEQLQPVLIIVAVASMFFGNIAAILQKNIKRLIAYSSISHMGFILMSIAIYHQAYLEYIIFYAITYVTLTLTFFALVVVLNKKEGFDGSLKSLSGLSRDSAFLSLIFVVVMFSMAGIPPMAGFFAKFYIFVMLLKTGYYQLAIIAFITTVIGVFYYLNVIRAIYFEKQNLKVRPKAINFTWVEVLFLAFGAAFNLFYILFPSYMLDLIKSCIS